MEAACLIIENVGLVSAGKFKSDQLIYAELMLISILCSAV